ncbi:MAG: hypothetical protein JRF30_10990 [Deltaproteobacteria bacterium]|nr:hypothetical protein [Deltaproteobacteria bacterium]
MGGRFGKYGDAKRKAQIRKNRLRPPDLQQRRKNKPWKGLERAGCDTGFREEALEGSQMLKFHGRP